MDIQILKLKKLKKNPFIRHRKDWMLHWWQRASLSHYKAKNKAKPTSHESWFSVFFCFFCKVWIESASRSLGSLYYLDSILLHLLLRNKCYTIKTELLTCLFGGGSCPKLYCYRDLCMHFSKKNVIFTVGQIW